MTAWLTRAVKRAVNGVSTPAGSLVTALSYAGFAAVLFGYLTVWLPLEPAGLRLIGLELGEWTKFLPQMRAGEVANRNLFYIPPITLALTMILFTAQWPARYWKTWAFRFLAAACAWLSFPAVEVILSEPSTEWRLRLAWVGLVIVTAVSGSWLGHFLDRWAPLLVLLLALIGAVLPAYAYFSVRPAIVFWVRSEIGVGGGLWLTILGHVLIGSGAAVALLRPATVNKKTAHAPSSSPVEQSGNL